MPKVYLTKTDESKAKFTAWIYGQMKLRKYSQQTLAKKRGISHQALSRKLLTQSYNFEDFLFFVNEFQPSDKELRDISGI